MNSDENNSRKFSVIKTSDSFLDDEEKIDSLSSETDEETKENKILSFVSDNMKESPSLVVTRWDIIKQIPILMGAVSGVSYSELAKKEAKNNTYLQYIFSGSTIVSVGISRMWAFSNIIERFEKTRAGLSLSSKKTSSRECVKHILINLFGVAACLSPGYAIYKYNGSYLCTLVTLFSEYSLATCGFYELYDTLSCKSIKYADKLFKSESPEENIKNRDEAFHLFDKLSIRVLAMKESEFKKFEDDYERLSLTTLSFPLLQEILVPYLHEKEDKVCFLNFFKLIFNTIPVSNFVVNALLSWKGGQEIDKSLFFLIPYIAITTIPPFILGISSVNSTVDNVSNEYLGKKSSKIFFIKSSYPKIYSISGILAFSLAAGATSWGAYLSQEVLKDYSYSEVNLFLTVAYGLGIFIFESFAIREYFNNLAILYSQYYGDSLIKQKIYTSRQFSKIAQGIKDISSEGKDVAASTVVYNAITQTAPHAE